MSAERPTSQVEAYRAMGLAAQWEAARRRGSPHREGRIVRGDDAART